MPFPRTHLTKEQSLMACLRRYGSGPYHLELRFSGQKLQRSLGTKKKKEAERLLGVVEQTAALINSVSDNEASDLVHLTAFTWSGFTDVAEGTGNYTYSVTTPGAAPAPQFGDPLFGSNEGELPPIILPGSATYRQQIKWNTVNNGLWGGFSFKPDDGWEWAFDEIAIVDITVESSELDYSEKSYFNETDLRYTLGSGGAIAGVGDVGATFDATVRVDGPQADDSPQGDPGAWYGTDKVELGFLQNIELASFNITYTDPISGISKVNRNDFEGDTFLDQVNGAAVKPWYTGSAVVPSNVQPDGSATVRLIANDTPTISVRKIDFDDQADPNDPFIGEASSVAWEWKFKLHVAAHTASADSSTKELFYSSAVANWNINGSGAFINELPSDVLLWNSAMKDAFDLLDQSIANGDLSMQPGGNIEVVSGVVANDILDDFSWDT